MNLLPKSPIARPRELDVAVHRVAEAEAHYVSAPVPIGTHSDVCHMSGNFALQSHVCQSLSLRFALHAPRRASAPQGCPIACGSHDLRHTVIKRHDCSL